jgi:ankyrin repeat protein
MWAARRDNAYMVSNLIDMGADLLPQSNEGFTALDYAVVHGNYRPALFLYDFMDQLKGHLDYYQFGKDRDYRYVNYEMFLTHLKAKTQYQQVPNFFQRPESTIINVNPNREEAA